MLNVYGRPTPDNARDGSSGIFQVVLALEKYLPEFGYRLTGDEASADLLAFHAGSGEGRTQVAHCHGLYPTAHLPKAAEWMYEVNRVVIEDIRAAQAVTVPSQWVADLIRRDMHFDPIVIPWGVDLDRWRHTEEHGQYILWNKNRNSDVCDPQWLNRLARQFPRFHFLSTFGDDLINVRKIGVIPHDKMTDIIKRAKVYLATTKETGDIGSREALAAGVPVLGFKQGALLDIVQHGVNGFLAEPGDFDGLCAGLTYIMQHWQNLHHNAVHLSADYSWREAVHQIANVYDQVLETRHRWKVSIVIPCFNYEAFIESAVRSACEQKCDFAFEVIAVNDGSTDSSGAILDDLKNQYANLSVYHTDNQGVAGARNTGIRMADAEYIVCLDADDQLAPTFLTVCVDALDKQPSAGIAYTQIKVMGSETSGWPAEFDYIAQTQRKNQIPTCCMFRKKWWQRAGGFRQIYHPAEDADLWLRMSTAGAKPIFIKKPLFLYRFHDDSASAPVRRMEIREPDWIAGKGWIKSNQIPFAAPKPSGSYPVRNYDRPKISIVIPIGPGHQQIVYDALDSIEGQSFVEWEVIAVDDTGGNLDGLERPYVRLTSTGGCKGAGAARNRGLELVSAPLVVFLDADDFLMADFLLSTYKRYQQTGDYIYTDWYSITGNGTFTEHITPEFRPDRIYMEGAFHAVTCLLETKAARIINGFDETLQSWEDVEFFMRLIANGYCGERLASPLVAYRIHTGGRRDQGVKMQQLLKPELARRFARYVKGEEVPMCKCKPKTSATGWQAQDLIEVQYEGPKGNHAVIGPVTRTNYGVREGGQRFMVFAPDVEAAPKRFSPITQIIEEPVLTEVPPAPEVL